MVTCLSSLASLERLIIEFQSPHSRPGRRLPRPTRTFLPARTLFGFNGVSEYLEGFVAQPVYNPLPSTNIRHSTTRQLHRSHTKFRDKR